MGGQRIQRSRIWSPDLESGVRIWRPGRPGIPGSGWSGRYGWRPGRSGWRPGIPGSRRSPDLAGPAGPPEAGIRVGQVLRRLESGSGQESWQNRGLGDFFEISRFFRFSVKFQESRLPSKKFRLRARNRSGIEFWSSFGAVLARCQISPVFLEKVPLSIPRFCFFFDFRGSNAFWVN